MYELSSGTVTKIANFAHIWRALKRQASKGCTVLYGGGPVETIHRLRPNRLHLFDSGARLSNRTPPHLHRSVNVCTTRHINRSSNISKWCIAGKAILKANVHLHPPLEPTFDLKGSLPRRVGAIRSFCSVLLLYSAHSELSKFFATVVKQSPALLECRALFATAKRS